MTASPSQRSLANILGIITAGALIAFAAWGGSLQGLGTTDEAARPVIPVFVHFGAGMLVLAGVLVAQKWNQRGLGRALFALAGIALLVTLIVFRYFGPWAWMSLVVPAVLLFVAATLLGPVPPPETHGIDPASGQPTN